MTYFLFLAAKAGLVGWLTGSGVLVSLRFAVGGCVVTLRLGLILVTFHVHVAVTTPQTVFGVLHDEHDLPLGIFSAVAERFNFFFYLDGI
ncbi:unnamed protein product [Thelazia callipaeda]|uniref:Secreted protein n=1 Tax=Thelazia callipaeda TaxID=103827 RepID=A0A0N5CS36_THECL|nr:unnamed protein product [Thelazia callipaeda]